MVAFAPVDQPLGEPHITYKRPGRKIGCGGLENGYRELQNTPRSII